jgi:bifunctional ADP-heptose synthase (sugar kinase/adenylyltransferase)
LVNDEAGRTLGRSCCRDGANRRRIARRPHDIDTIVKLRVIGRQQQLLRIDFETAFPRTKFSQAKLAEFRACAWLDA